MWVRITSFVSAGSIPASSSAWAGVRSNSRPRRAAETGLNPVSMTMVRGLPADWAADREHQEVQRIGRQVVVGNDDSSDTATVRRPGCRSAAPEFRRSIGRICVSSIARGRQFVVPARRECNRLPRRLRNLYGPAARICEETSHGGCTQSPRISERTFQEGTGGAARGAGRRLRRCLAGARRRLQRRVPADDHRDRLGHVLDPARASTARRAA